MYIYFKRMSSSESLSLIANYNSFPWFSFLNLRFLSLSLTSLWKTWANTGKTMNSDNDIGQICGPGWGSCSLEGSSVDASSFLVLHLVSCYYLSLESVCSGIFSQTQTVQARNTKYKAIIYWFIWFLLYAKVATVWQALRLMDLWPCRIFAGRVVTKGTLWPPQLLEVVLRYQFPPFL